MTAALARSADRDGVAEADAADLTDTRPDWPEDWQTRRDAEDAVACQRLWQALLMACLRDAVEDLLSPRCRPTPAQRKLGMAPAGWIHSRDFHMTCALAGVEGAAVAALVDQAVARPGGLADLAARLATSTHLHSVFTRQRAA
tara:strand:- start:2266 stop:2694 length:429 start_codon:yes stop_codon:yes gene_type:complete